MRRYIISIFLLCISISLVTAQYDCPQIVQEAIDALDIACTETGRNQACYGNINLQAELFPPYDFTFETVGDIIDLQAISTLTLSSMNTQTGEWGVALLNVQADIPDTLPGQNVTFILFGDVAIQNVASAEQNPMQAFYLRTGIGDAGCDEAPESGLLVQTPEGVEAVNFNVNGVDVTVGSSMLIQAAHDDRMTLTIIEGTGGIRLSDGWAPILAGTRVSVPLDSKLLPLRLPYLPESYDRAKLQSLPIRALPRPISIVEGFNSDQIGQLHTALANNEMPCDRVGLPNCDSSSLFERTLLPSDAWGASVNATTQFAIINKLNSVETRLQPISSRTSTDLPVCDYSRIVKDCISPTPLSRSSSLISRETSTPTPTPILRQTSTTTLATATTSTTFRTEPTQEPTAIPIRIEPTQEPTTVPIRIEPTQEPTTPSRTGR